jgi:hypothetical protein
MGENTEPESEPNEIGTPRTRQSEVISILGFLRTHCHVRDGSK